MSAYTLAVKIVGDDNRFIQAMDDAERKINDLTNKLEKSTVNFGAVGASLESIGGKITKVGEGLTNKITKPALVATGALIGLTALKGWNRFKLIDEARSKLVALGNSASDVTEIMDNARSAVLGTAYNLDEAASTAAAAVAAGIKPGKDLTKYLSGVADASAVAGISMQEMGSIFNKVAANGKASAEEINQLADRGVPIWQYLAKETGKSVEQVRKDLAAGKIDINTFRAAIENNIGGAAKTMGAISWGGMVSNLEAAIGRIGYNFIGLTDEANSLSSVFLGLGNDLVAALEPIEAKSAELGQTAGATLKMIVSYFKQGIPGAHNWVEAPQQARDAFKKLEPALEIIKNFVSRFKELSTQGKLAFGGLVIGIGPALSAFGKLVSFSGQIFSLIDKLKEMGLLAKIGPMFSQWIAPIAAVVAVFALLWTQSENFRNSVMNLVDTIASVLQPVFEQIIPVISAVWEMIKTLAGIIGDLLSPVIDWVANKISALAPIFQVFGAVLGVAAELVSVFAKEVKSNFEKVKNDIKNALDKVKGFFDKLKLKLPDIKLPHFKISGKLSISPPSVPKLSVAWYKTGGIFTGPQVVGVGEAGPEAVIPISKLDKFINNNQSSTDGMLISAIKDLAQAVVTSSRGPQIVPANNQKIVIEIGGTKVAEKIFRLSKEGQMILEG